MNEPTKEKVIEMAQKAGFTVRNGVIKAVHSNGSWVELGERLAEFAALAYAAGQTAEREACAAMLDQLEQQRDELLVVLERIASTEIAHKAHALWDALCMRHAAKDAIANVKGDATIAYTAQQECSEPKSDGWISVLDRLPETGGLYTVYLSSTEFGGVRKDGSVGLVDYDVWSTEKSCWVKNNNVVSEIPCYIESVITHWKPIQPPSDASKTPIPDEERDKIIGALKIAKGGAE